MTTLFSVERLRFRVCFPAMRILSGIQPSGALHLGNYFGMMRPAIELAKLFTSSRITIR